MRYPMGPHQRRGRRRRRLKALIVAAVLLMLLLASTWMVWQPPPPADKGPSVQELAVAGNLYKLSGDRGYAHEYLLQWPQHADYIRGETDSIDICE